MVILGIDPGTGRTGYGVIEKVKNPALAPGGQKLKVKTPNSLALIDYGCIVTTKEHQMGERLYTIQKEMKKLLKKYQPDCVVVEKLFFGANSQTAMAVGQARGVILAAVAATKVPIFEYTGLEVKLVVSGFGRAKKVIIKKRVRSVLGKNKRSVKFSQKDGGDDAADALACAITHAFKIAS